MATPTIPGSRQPEPVEEEKVEPAPIPEPEPQPVRAPASSPTPEALAPDYAPLPIGGTDDPGQYDPNIRPMPTFSEGMGAAVEEGFNNWFSSSIGNTLSVDMRKNLQGHQKVQPSELNAKFPNLAKPFSEPTTLSAATWIAQQQEERQLRMDLIDRQSTLGYGAAKLTGLITEAADPVNIAIAFATGGVASLAMKAGSLAAPVSTLGRLAFGIGENLVGNVPQAVAGYYSNRALQYNQTAGEAAMGAVEGAVVGTIGFKALGWGIGKAARLLSPAARYAAERIGIAQVIEGKRVDLSFMDTVFMRAAKAEAPTPKLVAGQEPYRFSPILAASEAKGKAFFAVEGQGGLLTDNPAIANAAAAGPHQATPRQVHEVDLDKLNLVTLQGELHPDLQDAFLPVLREITGSEAGALDLASKSSPGDLFSLVRTAVQEGRITDDQADRLFDSFREKGIDGVIYNPAERMADASDPAQNAVMLFKELPDSAIKRKFLSDPEMLKDQVKPEEFDTWKEHTLSQRSDADFDPKSFDEFKKTMEEDVPPPQPSQADKESTDLIASVKEMSDQGFIDPVVMKEIDEIVEARRMGEIEEEVTKLGAGCLKVRG